MAQPQIIVTPIAPTGSYADTAASNTWTAAQIFTSANFTVDVTSSIVSASSIIGTLANFSNVTASIISASNTISNNITASVSIITPKLIGGNNPTSALTFQTTTGVGTQGANINFLVGNNGDTSSMVILNSGYIGMGSTATKPSGTLDIRGPSNVPSLLTGTAGGRVGSFYIYDNELNSGWDVNNVFTTYLNWRGYNFGTAQFRHFFLGNGKNGNILYSDGSTGNVGIGTVSPSSRLHLISTTEQLRIGITTSSYYSTTVNSSGLVTFDATGSNSGFVFSDPVLFSGSRYSYLEKSSSYTIIPSDYTINCISNTFIVSLSSSVGILGQIFNIKNTGSGSITVSASLSETIDGSSEQIINQWTTLTVQSTGTNWIII